MSSITYFFLNPSFCNLKNQQISANLLGVAWIYEHILPKLLGKGRDSVRERGSVFSFIFINYIRGRNDLSFIFLQVSKNDMIFCLVFFHIFQKRKVADDNHKKTHVITK